jgi:hypothetical protein
VAIGLVAIGLIVNYLPQWDWAEAKNDNVAEDTTSEFATSTTKKDRA